MDDKRDQTRPSLIRASSTALAVFMFYVLSVGPAAWICQKTDPRGSGWQTRIGRVAYAPLDHVVEATNTIDLAERYMKLFR
jgi:hypothetical protein